MGGVDTGGGRTVSNGFDDGTTMRAAPLWRVVLAAEYAVVRARLRQAIEVDEECEEAV